MKTFLQPFLKQPLFKKQLKYDVIYNLGSVGVPCKQIMVTFQLSNDVSQNFMS